MSFRGLIGAACLVLFQLNILAVPTGYAQKRAVPAPINRPFVDPDFDAWRRRFERPGREIYDRRHHIVVATGVQPGMTVADIGAGTGLFTRLFSTAVGESGRVYAVDISPAFVDNILRISRELGQRNVEGIVNSPTDVMLSPDSVDLAFICDTYHHFEHAEATMKSILRALKPDGSVVVIDFRKIPGLSSPWVMSHVRAGEARVVREIEAAGFRLVEDRDFLRSNYFLRFSVAPD
ncbi:MAG: methyltransferase domain-containing protein [Gammaproteobacteria bacterium]|jgi:predicted methyltransferase